MIRCLDIAAEVGADYIAYRPLIGTPHVQITRPLEELAALGSLIRQHATRLGVGQQFAKFVGTFDKATAGQPLARDARCPVVSEGLIAFVAATGDVLPCYAHLMNGRTTSFGNITRHRFHDIWTGPLRQQVVRAIDAARTCPFCRYQPINAMLWNQADQKLGIQPQPTPGYDEHSRLPDMGFTRDNSDPHWMFL
ncbi:MAG: SPASM domain-containing protein [Pseudonocardiaceae bacterium]